MEKRRLLGDPVRRTNGGIRGQYQGPGKPLFVSSGHKVNLDDAVRITLGCTGRYRIPEPLRCADMLSRSMKDGYGA